MLRNDEAEPRYERSVTCACKDHNVISIPPKGFEHLRGKCFRCLCWLRKEAP